MGRDETGLDRRVQEMVLRQPGAACLVQQAIEQIDRGIIFFGCAKGRHRSVALAEAVRHQVRENCEAGLAGLGMHRVGRRMLVLTLGLVWICTSCM